MEDLPIFVGNDWTADYTSLNTYLMNTSSRVIISTSNGDNVPLFTEMRDIMKILVDLYSTNSEINTTTAYKYVINNMTVLNNRLSIYK
jgi:hypothetical protein